MKQNVVVWFTDVDNRDVSRLEEECVDLAMKYEVGVRSNENASVEQVPLPAGLLRWMRLVAAFAVLSAIVAGVLAIRLLLLLWR